MTRDRDGRRSQQMKRGGKRGKCRKQTGIRHIFISVSIKDVKIPGPMLWKMSLLYFHFLKFGDFPPLPRAPFWTFHLVCALPRYDERTAEEGL